jgi:uncharacterized protein YndB with AHSA1/START domain
MTQATQTRALVARRTIPASRRDVFAAWTEPDELIGWFGGRSANALSAAVDLRVGGAYRLTFQHGNEVRAVEGVYREVEVLERLVFTWRWDVPESRESVVTVELHDRDGATEVVVIHDGLESVESLVFHQGGWSASLEQLGAVL